MLGLLLSYSVLGGLYMLASTRLLGLDWGCAGLAVERPSLALAVHAAVVHCRTLRALAPPADQAAGAALRRMAPQEAPQLLCSLQGRLLCSHVLGCFNSVQGHAWAYQDTGVRTA